MAFELQEALFDGKFELPPEQEQIDTGRILHRAQVVPIADIALTLGHAAILPPYEERGTAQESHPPCNVLKNAHTSYP